MSDWKKTAQLAIGITAATSAALLFTSTLVGIVMSAMDDEEPAADEPEEEEPEEP